MLAVNRDFTQHVRQGIQLLRTSRFTINDEGLLQILEDSVERDAVYVVKINFIPFIHG